MIPNSLKLVTLTGCPKCKELKELLKKSNTFFQEVSCEQDPTFCDNLEAMSSQDHYPMALIEASEKIILIHTTEDSKELGKTIPIDKNFFRIPVYGMENMSTTIKNTI
jgi:glutaredoxin